jgi:hypothetical protein
MNIFDLHRDVLADYCDFVRSFVVIADDRAREFVDHALEREARLWPDLFGAGESGLRLEQQGVELTLASQLLTVNLVVGRDRFKRAAHGSR